MNNSSSKLGPNNNNQATNASSTSAMASSATTHSLNSLAATNESIKLIGESIGI